MTLPTKKGAELSTTKKTIHQGRHTDASRTRLEEKMDIIEEQGTLERWTQEQYSQALDNILYN